MIIALAEVARSSRTAVQPLDRTEAHHWTMQSRKLRLTDGLELGTLKRATILAVNGNAISPWQKAIGAAHAATNRKRVSLNITANLK